MIVIGITGTIGAGKGTVVEYLVKKGFKHYSVRKYLTDILTRKNVAANRANLVFLANELRRKFGSGYIAKQLYRQARVNKENAVIESLRNTEEVQELKRRGKFYLFSIDADLKLRYKRIRSRSSETDRISFEEFLKDEKKETTSENPNDSNLLKVMKLADFKFTNNKSRSHLYKKVNQVLKKIF